MSYELTGLFLGAGASFEVGMPLVWEVTDQLRPLLSRETLLRRRPQFNGARVPEVILEELAGLVSRPEQHYESILGHLETEFRRPTNPLETQRHYSGLYVWLVECVSRILVRRHVADAEYLRQNLRFLSGIKHFAAHNSPLWVFSLNHDLVVECLAAEHGIPVNSGFGREVTALPRRDARGRKQGELRAAVLSASALENSRWSFATHGAPEINLLKIHGALDVFAFRDGLDFLKLLPDETSATGLIDMLRAANEEVIYVDPRTQRQPSATNEIAYADDAGEMQFLRRSLLSGAFKFDERRGQVLSRRFLEAFQANINQVTHLVCIGYSFGDEHINRIIRAWLEVSRDRRVEIVDPGIVKVPQPVLHLSSQITLTKARASDYLDTAAGIVRDRHDVLMKRLARWGRTRPTTEGQAKFASFARQWQEERARRFVTAMAALPRRDGQLDVGALGMTAEECATKLSADIGGDADDMLEAFLDQVATGTEPTPGTSPKDDMGKEARSA